MRGCSHWGSGSGGQLNKAFLSFFLRRCHLRLCWYCFFISLPVCCTWPSLLTYWFTRFYTFPFSLFYLFPHEKTFFRLKICYQSDCLIFVFPLFPAKIFLELKIYYWSDCQSVRRAFNTAGVEGWVGDFQTIIKSNEKVSEMTGNHCICVFSFPM